MIIDNLSLSSGRRWRVSKFKNIFTNHPVLLVSICTSTLSLHTFAHWAAWAERHIAGCSCLCWRQTWSREYSGWYRRHAGEQSLLSLPYLIKTDRFRLASFELYSKRTSHSFTTTTDGTQKVHHFFVVVALRGHFNGPGAFSAVVGLRNVYFLFKKYWGGHYCHSDLILIFKWTSFL